MSTKDNPVKGEGLLFILSEEVNIAYNENKVDLNAAIKVKLKLI